MIKRAIEMKNYKNIIIFLNSKNFHSWIIKMKNIAIKAKVWKYVDSKKKTSKSSNSILSRLLHYFVKKISEQSNQNDAFVSVKKSVCTFDEFSSNQKKSYKMNIIVFQMKKKGEWSNRAWNSHSWCSNQNIDAYVYFFRKNEIISSKNIATTIDSL